MQILGLSLALMALASAAIFAFSTGKEMKISIEEDHVRAFKGEESGIVVAAQAMGSTWLGSQAKTFGLENAEVLGSEPLAEGRVRLRFLGRYAGRSRGVKVSVVLTDPLGLFQKVEEVAYERFSLDVLPRALLAPASPRRVAVFGLGELPAGFPGTGQELYGLDHYRPTSETKDIIWRRVAKSPDEALVARTRESNVKERVTVAIIQLSERGDRRAPWMDVLCEGLASFGKEVLEMGAGLTLLYPTEGGMVSEDATDIDELADAVMSYSVSPRARDVPEAVMRSDLIVTGVEELEDGRVRRAISEMPALLISEGEDPRTNRGGAALVYSGSESLLPLVRKVLER